MNFRDEIKYPYELMGYTFHKDKVVCNKCGKEVDRGIISISTHWNECIDVRKTLNALLKAREEKGSELTIYDLDNILP